LLYNNYLVTSRKYAVLKNVEENKLKWKINTMGSSLSSYYRSEHTWMIIFPNSFFFDVVTIISTGCA
jgi:hypothetical protein